MSPEVATINTNADIRAMLAEPPGAGATPPKQEAPPGSEAEPDKPAEAKVPEPAAGTGEPKQEPEPPAAKTEEQPLPEGVRKKIAKENERAQRAINEAIAKRKAAEDALAKLADTGKSGSDPAPTTEPAKAATGPVEPELQDFTTYAEFKTAEKKWRQEHQDWLIGETRKTVTAEIAAQQQRQAADREMDAAIEKHGADLPEHLQTLATHSTADFQRAVSGLDDWAGTAKYLAQHLDRLEEITATFARNPVKAIAELGRIEASLKGQQAPKAAPAAAKPLPDPPRTVGGSASAAGSVDLDTASMAQFKSAVRGMLQTQA